MTNDEARMTNGIHSSFVIRASSFSYRSLLLAPRFIMKRRVVVTGIGAVTSLSCKVDDLWQKILRGESGIHELKAFDTTGHKVKFGGDIYDWSTDGYIDRKEEKRIDRFTQFALVAGIDAVNDSGLDFSKEDPFRCGVILGSGIGGLNEIEAQHERLLTKGPDKVSAFTIPKLMLNAASGHVSIRYGLRGPNYAVATACASATNAMGDAFKAIQYDDADVMVTGGTEAACTPMGLAGFANMRALSERHDDPAGASRPFDTDRDGFVLSEGAGMLVFEELEHAKPAGRRIYAEVLGYGASADAGHITQPDAEGTGAAKAMAGALRDAQAQPRRDRLHQRPRHEHAAGRQGRDDRHQDGLRRPRPQGEHLQHQEPARPSAGRERRRGAGRSA